MSSGRGIAFVSLMAIVTAVAAIEAFAEAPPYLCAPARLEQDGSSPASLAVTDRFATRELTLARSASVCWAAAPATGMLEGYAARRRKARRIGAAVDIVTRFGRQSLTLTTLGELRVPSAGGGPVPSVLACYGVQRGRTSGPRPRVVVTDAVTGEQTFDVGRPLRVCVPPAGESAPELVCHAVRLARTKPLAQRAARAHAVTLTTRYGTDVLRVAGARELCVPALGLPDPDPELQPAFSLEVTPRTLEALAGTRPVLEATAHFPDGHTESYTSRIVWSSSDESVVRVVTSSTAGAFFDAVGPGSAILSATDPATGIGSADTDGNATVTVTWPLEKLVLTPHATTRQPGSYLGYTVTGWFTGGTTRNLTQRMVYASSNPAVAVATNMPGNRSRVVAVAPGTATISATDPISGISTTDSGNDATMRVAGTLLYVVVTSNLRYSSRFPGQSQRFTANGYYSDGSYVNLTQECDWSSSNPSVAVATNPDGDRSRIDALSSGYAIIGCTDPLTGRGAVAGFYVLGALQALEVYGALSPHEWLRTGASTSLTALGVYEGGGRRNLTQELEWTSRDPAIAVATNEPGNRSRVVGINGGVARVFASDPTTGITSSDQSVTALGDLVSLEIFGTWNPTVLPLDYTRLFPVRGIFEYGTLNLTFAQPGYTLVSSNPAVLAIVNDRYVRGVAPGIVDLTARDDTTGITSPPVPIRVKGALDHITLTPPAATRGIGEWESFTAIGYYPPDLTELLTQRLTYTSSDPSVVVADNIPYTRSGVRAVGAGTATITATDPLTGVAGTATITVLPGTIERVTIQPATILRNIGNDFSFTAIGHYPDGATINVTQIVTWQSLAPQVASANNVAGDRSRVIAVDPGTATIVASHPSGVSSHDTGDDATFVAKPLVSLALTPASHLGPVGMVERYTLVGTFDDASTINLTQDAYYGTDNTAVARADNLEGDRSAVELLAPGATTVHASFADWSGSYPVVSGSPAGAFLAVEP